jgi:hypothetical protein
MHLPFDYDVCLARPWTGKHHDVAGPGFHDRLRMRNTVKSNIFRLKANVSVINYQIKLWMHLIIGITRFQVPVVLQWGQHEGLPAVCPNPWFMTKRPLVFRATCDSGCTCFWKHYGWKARWSVVGKTRVCRLGLFIYGGNGGKIMGFSLEQSTETRGFFNDFWFEVFRDLRAGCMELALPAAQSVSLALY